MPTPNENAECRAMLQNLRRRGCRVCKIASGSDIACAKTMAILKTLGLEGGVADYVCVLPDGFTFFLEMKVRRGGVVSPAQRRWHREIRAMGATVLVGHGAEHACSQVVELAASRGVDIGS